MKLSTSVLFLLIFLSATLASCEAIGDVFKAGFWAAIIVVVLVVGIIIWLIGKFKRK